MIFRVFFEKGNQDRHGRRSYVARVRVEGEDEGDLLLIANRDSGVPDTGRAHWVKVGEIRQGERRYAIVDPAGNASQAELEGALRDQQARLDARENLTNEREAQLTEREEELKALKKSLSAFEEDKEAWEGRMKALETRKAELAKREDELDRLKRKLCNREGVVRGKEVLLSPEILEVARQLVEETSSHSAPEACGTAH